MVFGFGVKGSGHAACWPETLSVEGCPGKQFLPLQTDLRRSQLFYKGHLWGSISG